MSVVFSVLAAVLLLGILVTIHEFGHFLFARLCGIEVKEFAVGFGPKLWSREGSKGTVFSLRAIPMGGFCAFYAEDDLEGKEKDDPRAWGKQPVWKRMISVLMGPGMNFVLAFAVLTLWFTLSGVPVLDLALYEVEPGHPAESAGMAAGDRITSINGEQVQGQVSAISSWKEGDDPLTVIFIRQSEDGEEEYTAHVSPFWDEEMQCYRLGIRTGSVYRLHEDGSPVTRRLSILEASGSAWQASVNAGGAILEALRQLVSTGEGLDETSGPVGVVTIISQEVRTGGFEAFVNLLTLISINLGIMNLLPIPGLDGSRFLFLVLEAVRRRPIPPQKEAMVNLAGMALLFAFMIFLTFRDVARLFQ